MSIAKAIADLVQAVAEENAVIADLLQEGAYIGSIQLQETVAREMAQLELEAALEIFVDQRIKHRSRDI